MTITEETISLPTPTGEMRTLISRPSATGRYAGIVLFSEIFQITGPIRRTAAFGDGWLPQGTRRRDLPGQIAQLRQLRDEFRGGAPIDIGTIVEPIYLTSGGSGWDLPSWVLSGGADEVASSLRELVDMGVNHLQVRFMARSAEEFCEQTARFGVEVGALLNH